MSMPRVARGRARVHDRDAARQDRPQHAGRRARRQHVDAAAFGQRAVVADAERFDARRAHLRRRARRADRPAGSTAAAAAVRRDESTGSSRRCARCRRAGNRGRSPRCRVPTSSCASSVDAAMCGVAIDLRQLGERPIGRRLVFEDVERRRRRRCRFRCARRSAASSISSPRAVLMMPDARLAAREPRVVEQVLRFRRRRQVQRQVVGRRAQLVERQQLDAEAGRDLRRDVRIVRDDRACRTRARAAPLPGRCGRGRRCRASCRAARCRETASSPTCRPSSRDRRRAPMRASASISAQACSATLMLLAPGALTTRMPRALAAATSTLSTPVPARRDDPQAAAPRRAAPRSTFVALRTSSASASARSAASAAGCAPGARIDVPAASARSSSSAEAGRSSATTIFNGIWLASGRGCCRRS